MISPRTMLFFICLPASLYTMDNTNMLTLTIQQKRDLKNLYQKTYTLFGNLTPMNDQRHNSLLTIISEIDNLKKTGLSETLMQEFAFLQKEAVSDRIRAELAKHPYNGPTYICTLFRMISEYNNAITADNLITPSLEQCYIYEDNLRYGTAKTQAQSLGIDITSHITSKQLIKSIPTAAAVQHFHQLMGHACNLRTTDPNAILTIAGILCLPAGKITPNINTQL